MAELVECKHIFSNGSEYMWFLEHNCDNCTRFRNGHCRIYNRLELSRFDESVFPYSDLMEHEQYSGKVCKSFTTEPRTIKRHRKEVEGQTEIEIEIEVSSSGRLPQM